jgi:LuxR family maltose regulon positive regulatory protein
MPEGHVRLFLDEGAPMAALLRDAQQQGIAPNHVGRLLRALATSGARSVTAPPVPYPAVEALSARELQVLRLLDSPLSGPEIARKLFVSLNTLRTHTKHIFAKLEVNNRAAAVRQAKERSLL